MILALDLAKKAGFCLYSPVNNVAFVDTVTGDPISQLNAVRSIVMANGVDHVAIELLTSMRNAKTVRSLAERTGFIRYSLKNEFELDCSFHSCSAARKHIGVRNKAGVLNYFSAMNSDINGDEADALAIALIAAGVNPKKITIMKGMPNNGR